MDDHARHLVIRFYEDVWNARDEDAAHDILSPTLHFRGSLGSERVGIEGFLDYAREIHAALGDYRCTIDDLITDGGKAAARMTFTGIHRGNFLGQPATGKTIRWAGAAFFDVVDRKIATIWVLGDVQAIKRQLLYQ